MLVDFIEIGTCDFDTEIQRATNDTVGISIEPITYYLNRLPDRDNCKKFNCAISDENGDCDIYYVPLENITKFGWQPWVTGCNSINSYHPTVLNLAKEGGWDIDEVCDKLRVKKYTLYTFLMDAGITGIKLLKIDTEGHDTHILKKFLEEAKDDSLLPHTIRFESNELSSPDAIKEVVAHLGGRGYMRALDVSGDACFILKGKG